jgi:hypothetical protein
MRNTIFFNVLIFIGLLFSSNLMAQGNKTTVSISSGQFFKNPISGSSSSVLGSGSTTQTSKFTPHIALRVERRLLKTISIGLTFNSMSAESDRTINNGSFQIFTGTTFTTVNNETNERVSSKMNGMSFNLKVFLHSSEDFEVYINGGLGVLSNKENIVIVNSTGNGRTNVISNPTDAVGLMELGLGMRYFLANNLGVYGEINTAKIQITSGGVGQLGVIYRF